MNNLGKAAVLVIAVLILIGGWVWFTNLDKRSENNNTEDLTPSPTSVSSEVTDPWLTFKYIRPVDWPPTVNTQSGPFTCTEAGSSGDRAGKTEKRVIESSEYCITEVKEGAAGSVYTQYAFARDAGNNTVKIATFSIQEVQCGNYSEPEMSECEKEQSAFNIDKVIGPSLGNLFNN